MKTDSCPDPAVLAAELTAMELISELLASTGSGQLPQRLTEQLREFTGARTVLLIIHSEHSGPHEVLYACPPRRDTLFSTSELGYFCPHCTPEELPRLSAELPSDHPLRALLLRSGVKSLLRFPLCVTGKLVGSLLLLDLPEPEHMDEVVKALTPLLPMVAMVLKSTLAYQRIESQARELELQARTLERRVVQRTADLETANESLAASRLAALNMMEDAVAAQRRAEETATLLQREVAERKQAEEALRRAHAELQQRVLDRTAQLAAKNEELKGFAYTVSHDLKAPLRGIAGYADELDRKHRAGLSERAQFCINQILTATRNQDRLIEDLLHYSRLDAETPSLTDVNLRNMVSAILEDRNLLIATQHVEVTVDLPFATLRTWDRGLLQVLANLIDNALKYSRKASPPRIGVRAEESEHGWRLVVSDNGIGFDMKYLDRIFGLFNRLVREEEFEGTGAGLAIAKKVLDKQGGRIWAESAPDQGATFFVELPRA